MEYELGGWIEGVNVFYMWKGYEFYGQGIDCGRLLPKDGPHSISHSISSSYNMMKLIFLLSRGGSMISKTR
jgi:hypothetical protein